MVAAVVTSVARFRIGNKVYFCNDSLGDRQGNYAESAIVDQQFVARKPASILFAQAAAFLVFITD